VVVTAVDVEGRVAEVTATALDGTYTVALPAGHYTVKTDFAAFSPASRDVAVDPSTCGQRADIALTLASRAPAPHAEAAAAASAPPATAAPHAVAAASAPADRAAQAGRGRGGRPQAAQPFESLALRADEEALARVDENGVASDAAAVLPPGFSPDSSSESVASVGSSAANATIFGPNGGGDFGDRFTNFDAAGQTGPGQAAGAGAFGVFDGGGRAGFGGRGGGPFGGAGGPFGRGGRAQQIRGSVYSSIGSSALDAAPYSLNGQPTPKPEYLQQRIGATLGGPLVIPKVVNSPRTFFFLNYTGNHSRNPFDAYSTVPTVAERGGDLSATGRAVVDPSTGQPFANNRIPSSRIDPAAQQLLDLIPLPNQDGDRQNFHSVTTTTSELDDVNLRVVRTFGAAADGGRGGRGGGFGRRGAGGFGGGGAAREPGRAGVSNLNVAVHYRHSDNSNSNPFPTLGGETTSNAWDVPVGYSFTKGGMLHTIRGQFNRQRTQATNLYAFGTDVTGNAGLRGASTDPFDWGAPNLSLSSFTSVRDLNPAERTDRTIAIGDQVVKARGRQTFRIGGDVRDIHVDSRTDANARGTFVFTGLYSGVDFADFLLGLPQQSTVQFGPGLEQFRSRSWDVYAQDDWRASDRVTLNIGVRYEYYSPLAEAANRLATLDVAPGFSAAVPVEAGGVGPYAGQLPDTLVRPFRGGVAPRVGVAWRARTGTIVRAGYGINYNASVYQTIAQQLAAQPPFAVTNTVLATRAQPVPLETALVSTPSAATTNSYAVDPNYRLGLVQIWNLDVQRDLSRTVNVGAGYTGTKGSNLDILRAPNRDPGGGLRIPGVVPFLYESSEGDSILQSATLRVRKRLTGGFAASASYTLSKSIDDASSIGGGGVVVAQNDQDLAAERGLSSFDQRHRFTGDFTFELPFGPSRRWLQSGIPAALLADWQMNGSVQLASGTPFTARVLGDVRDVAAGTNGTLRANYTGAPIALADPTAQQFFNTAAFSIPAPGSFGNAGRNTIIGPGTSVMNLSVTRNVSLGPRRGLSLQVLGNNLLNTVQFASIDTVVNSPTFGQVTAVRPMRRVQLLMRFRF
jgi:hypothetical protein